MAVITVAQFAAQLNRPAAALLEQLQSAGVGKKSLEDALTEADKERPHHPGRGAQEARLRQARRRLTGG